MLHGAHHDPSSAPEPLLPLSTAQRDVWHAQLLEPNRSIYNIGGYVAIDGAVDRAAFERALRQVIDEADSLHLMVVDTPAGPRARVNRRHADIPFLDFSTHADADAAALAWMRAEAAKPFDLFAGPLFRHALLKIGDHRYAWFASLHHLVTDAFGMSMFVRRLGAVYGEQLGAPQKFTPATSWRDYLLDEAGYLESDACEHDRVYWREQLESHPDTAALSGRTPARPGEVIVSIARVAPAVVRRLERVGAASHATLAAVVLAATAVQLARRTGLRDIVLGVPMSGRTSPLLRRVYGFLSNVVPLRLDVDPYAPVAALVKQAGARLRQALRHQRYPTQCLRHDLGLVADAPNIYGTVVNILRQDAGANFGAHRGTVHFFTQASRVEDVTVTIHMGGASGLRVRFDANRARYDAASLDAIQRSFICLLESVADSAAGPTALLPLVNAEERQHLVYGPSPRDVAAPPARFLHELFERQAARTPDAVALIDGVSHLSYARLNACANRLAHRLIAAGVGPESIVGLCVERSPEVILALLAVSKAGGAYLPLDPSYPKARLSQMLTDASPAMVLFSQATARMWHEQELPSVAQPLILDAAPAVPMDIDADASVPLRPGASRAAGCQTPGLCHLHVRFDRNAQGGGGDARRLERAGHRVGASVGVSGRHRACCNIPR